MTLRRNGRESIYKQKFEEMKYDIIYGGCAKSNVESYKVMKKAGMVQNSFYDNGDYIFAIDKETFLNFKR